MALAFFNVNALINFKLSILVPRKLKSLMHKRFRIPEEFVHCTVVDSLDSQATDKPFTQTKQKLEEISMLCHFLGNQTERKRKKEKRKKDNVYFEKL